MVAFGWKYSSYFFEDFDSFSDYSYTFTYDYNGRKSAGLLAQEVEEVLPSAVFDKKLVFKTDDNQEYKTLQYDQTIALLVQSIKELKSEVDILKRDK